ncbi:MAG: DUF4336 domain-containing protein [Polyangiaceae bacterium]
MLRQEAENLWTADYSMKMPGGVPFPARMTVVRLSDGSLSLISPVPIDDALAKELAALGPVTYLLAPNLYHHLYLPAAKTRYPAARILGPQGLSAKQPKLEIAPLALTGAPFHGTLEALAIDGAPKLKETVFFHAPSRSLILCDLAFNIEQTSSWKTSVVLSMMGVRGRLGQSRAWNFIASDKTAAGASCRRMLEWDFDRLVVAHGEVVASGAKARLASALTRTRPV